MYLTELWHRACVQNLLHNGSTSDHGIFEVQTPEGKRLKKVSVASRVRPGEQRGGVRGGGARVRAGHVSGPAAARLRGPRGGGLLLQQEPRGQGAGLHADAGGAEGHAATWRQYRALLLSKWECG